MGRRMLDDHPDLPWLGQYILGGEDGHTPIPCYSLMKWGEWMEGADRRVVGWTGGKNKYVSTVFLALDHRPLGRGPPLLFESIAFLNEGKWHEVGGERFYYSTALDQCRYSCWDDAETGHRAMVRKYLVNPKTRVKPSEV
jgi:hypothetical protein